MICALSIQGVFVGVDWMLYSTSLNAHIDSAYVTGQTVFDIRRRGYFQKYAAELAAVGVIVGEFDNNYHVPRVHRGSASPDSGDDL